MGNLSCSLWSLTQLICGRLLLLLQASVIAERGQLLNDFFTYSLYTHVCRSLFERHKLLLSFILAVKTLQHVGSIDTKEWQFLLAGPTTTSSSSSQQAPGKGSASLANPAPDWLTDKAWTELLGLSQMPAYNGLALHIAHNLEHYKAIFDNNEVRMRGPRGGCEERTCQSCVLLGVVWFQLATILHQCRLTRCRWQSPLRAA